MAQEIGLEPLVDGRIYPELPPGIKRWSATVASVGAATSTMTFNLKFNNGDSEGFQPYVSVSHIGIQTSSVALTKFGVAVWQQNTDWEDSGGLTLPLGGFQMIEGAVATQYVGQWTKPYYFGRVEKGTTGQINIQLQEITSTDYNIVCSGLIGDRPFLAPNFWRP